MKKWRYVLMVMLMLVMSILVVSAEDVEIGVPFSLQIMGNANGDQVINDLDIARLQDIIAGKEKKNSLSDANSDGVVDEKDVDQVQKIIDGKEDTLWYINLNGDVSSVKHPLNKIVVVYDNTAEIIRILGAQEKVVGVDSMIADEKKYFPELSALPSIGNRKECNVEKILELNPDAVFIHAKSEMGCPDLEQKLKDKGIDVVRLGTWQSHTAVPSLMVMAYMLDSVDKAENYIAYQQKYLDTIKERINTIPAEKRVNVFIDRPGDTTVSKGSGYSEALEFAGGNNIAKKMSGGFEEVLPKVDAEWVVKQNPDLIIGLSWEGGYETNDENTVKKRYDEVVAKPGFSSTNAVKTNKIFITPYINVLGPGYHIGIIQFAKWLYPDLFTDMSVEQAQNEYLTNWQNTLYDLKNDGVFGYPST